MSSLSNSEDQWPSSRSGWYAAILLTIGYSYSFIDRQIINLLVEPIRADLEISDTQISFLQGFAFAITYVFMSIPIGRIVDRFNRTLVLAVGTTIYVISTCLCGLSNTYAQLLMARLGLGFGEASVTPASWSMLSDYFPPEKLARPISILLMGPYIGAGLSLMIGGEVYMWAEGLGGFTIPFFGEIKPWQLTFLAVGIPGFLLIILIATIADPPRLQAGKTLTKSAPVSWEEVRAQLRSNSRIYGALLLGVPAVVVTLYGLQAWVPSFLERVHGWDRSQIGRIYGLVSLVAGSAGVLAGPTLAGFLRKMGYLDGPLRLTVIATLATLFSVTCIPFMPSPMLSMVFIALASFSVTVQFAPVTTSLQIVTPNKMRGVVAGMYVVTVNLIGLGLGPTLVAASTDYIFNDPKAVGYSLALAAAVSTPFALIFLYRGLKPFQILVKDMEKLEDT